MRQLKINKSITPRSEESLDKYLTEISRLPMVTTDEEVALAQAIHAGGKKGEAAKDELVTADRKSTRLNSSHNVASRMPSSA